MELDSFDHLCLSMRRIGEASRLLAQAEDDLLYCKPDTLKYLKRLRTVLRSLDKTYGEMCIYREEQRDEQ